QNGFKVKNITGGYKTFIASKFNKTKRNNNKGNIEEEAAMEIEKKHINLEKDLCGLSCPGPLMEVKKYIDSLQKGEVLKVNASDPGFFRDIQSWCEKTNNTLLDISKDKGIISAVIKKDSLENKEEALKTKDNKTIIVFSGDLDKAIASFIIANGAVSMGKKVTMFFTFWGLNILRKSENAEVKKDFMEKMFGAMMPRGSEKLKLSKMNMGGIGPKLIRKIMNDKNVSSLEDLIKAAMDSGIEMVACQMTLDLLGIKKEELIDGVKIGGVGYMLGEAEESNMNLFI
ncbi:MAG: DsrE/DsrF/DrsH-like family protein, partial [Clostridium perfringens]|nr:DsrE/DsrF/DrsH-like family protein [Clostridium perfringens]